jgi:hypothetical protein
MNISTAEKLHALGERTDDQAAGDARERGLEGDEHQISGM